MKGFRSRLAAAQKAIYRGIPREATALYGINSYPIHHGLRHIRMKDAPLRSFRCVCRPDELSLVADLLRAQGFFFEAEPFCDFAFRLTHEPTPLGASLAAVFGYIYIQDRSSMLPALALAPESGAAALDICASPGGKTGMLAQLTGESGFVLGNEPSRNRLTTLRRNITAMNLFWCGTMSQPGEALPLPDADSGGTAAQGEEKPPRAGWPYILLDPPCSGWGTVAKNPKVMTLWQGDAVRPLISLQRALLAEAGRLLAPGGRLTYSTCTTNTEENEEQIRYACETLGFIFEPLSPVPGFSFAPASLSRYEGCLRVTPGEQGQGFFIATLRRPETGDFFAPSSGVSPKNAVGGKGRTRPPDGKWRASSGRSTGRAAPWSELLPREIPVGPGVDMCLLPPGEIRAFNGVAHFLPAPALSLIPPGTVWKGFPLGRLAGGAIRVNPALRGIMPTLDIAREKHAPHLDLDDIGPLSDLLSGRALKTNCQGPELLLYFRGLRLCRLTVKGGRALLPPR